MSSDSWPPNKPCSPATNWGLSMGSVSQLQVAQLAKIVGSVGPPVSPGLPLCHESWDADCELASNSKNYGFFWKLSGVRRSLYTRECIMKKI